MFSPDITFAYPEVFYALIIIPLMVAWFWWRGRKNVQAITYPGLAMLGKRKRQIKEYLAHTPLVFRFLAMLFFLIALARPQSFSTGEDIYTEGVDIILVLDLSGSMLAEDFSPNRLDAAKSITDDFINGRLSDRIGLVVFSRDAFTQCPLTMDYRVLRNLLSEVKSGMIEDGTALGNAIANGVNRLKESKSKSKVMILLTDGVSNAGEVDPITAAEIATKFGIRIYTIGVGTRGNAPYPFQTPFGIQKRMVPVEIDEQTLTKIADMTGGQYFRATGNKQLEQIYKEIDKLEKTKIEVTTYKNTTEHFYPWLAIGIALLLFEFLLSKTILRKLP